MLLAVAHGSRDPDAAQSVEALVAEVRRRRPVVDARACYLDHADPRLADALAAAGGPAVVVPLLLTAAYHSRVDIPAQTAAARHPTVQAAVLGPHVLLLAALERRLAEVGVQPGDPDTAVVLAAAGSADPEAVATVTALAGDWSVKGWWAVQAGYASAAEPSVEDAVAALRSRGAPRVAVASYLLSPGLFADRLAASGADVVGGPLGPAPEVADVVLARYDEAYRTLR